VIVWAVACAPAVRVHSYYPPNGYVPNEETAIRIAEAVWLPIYGREVVSKEKPFVAELRNGVWIVSGSLPKAPEGFEMIGGTLEIEISKSDGRILRVSHGE